MDVEERKTSSTFRRLIYTSVQFGAAWLNSKALIFLWNSLKPQFHDHFENLPWAGFYSFGCNGLLDGGNYAVYIKCVFLLASFECVCMRVVNILVLDVRLCLPHVTVNPKAVAAVTQGVDGGPGFSGLVVHTNTSLGLLFPSMFDAMSWGRGWQGKGRWRGLREETKWVKEIHSDWFGRVKGTVRESSSTSFYSFINSSDAQTTCFLLCVCLLGWGGEWGQVHMCMDVHVRCCLRWRSQTHADTGRDLQWEHSVSQCPHITSSHPSF